jgi:hemolysin activation/secretion protein
VGKGSVYGTRLVMPLAGTGSLIQNLNFGAEYKDFLENITSSPLDPQQAGSSLETPIRYVNLSVGYGGFWRGTGRQASLDTSLNFALRGLGNTAEQFENKRFQAESNYFYLRSSASFGAALPLNFTGLFKVSGQYAVEPLVSNEQFAIAGSDGVRGYLEAEVLADTGIKTTFQLGSPQLKFFAGQVHSDAFVFYDFGRIGVINPLKDEPGNVSLSAAGAGFNFSVFDHLSGVLTWAYPLANGSVTLAHDSRFLFSVRSTW